MVSVATSAAAQIAFAEKAASNRGSVVASGTLALVAGVFWFLLSENVSSAGRKIDALAPALKGREAAVDSLPRRSKIVGISFLGLACGFSIVWPWANHLGQLLRCSYRSLQSFF